MLPPRCRDEIKPDAFRPLVRLTALQHLDLRGCSLPLELELEVDAVPFPLRRLERWAAEWAGEN